jgi:PEP-CTERM motif
LAIGTRFSARPDRSKKAKGDTAMKQPTRSRNAAAAVLLLLGLLVAATPAYPVVVHFDLDTGTLTPDTPGPGLLDEYRSGAFFIGTHTFSPTRPNTLRPLSLEIRFVDAQSGLQQTITLRTLGLGGGENAPSTFGSISSPPGAHNFGPSMIVSNRTTDLDPFTVANATLSFNRITGPLAPNFNNSGGSVCGHGPANDCDFGVRLPDLLDAPGSLSFSGFNVDFGFGVVRPTTFDTFEFRLISPSLAVSVPEPETYAMMVAGLGLLTFMLRRRARRRR